VFALPRLLIPVESTPGETRIAATPDTVKKIYFARLFGLS